MRAHVHIRMFPFGNWCDVLRLTSSCSRFHTLLSLVETHWSFTSDFHLTFINENKTWIFPFFCVSKKSIKMILIAFKWKHIEFDFDFRFNVEYFPSILPSWMQNGISVRIENSITNRKFLFKFGETNLWHKIVLPPSGSMWAEVILWQTFILRVVLLSIKLYMNIIISEWFGCVQSVQR